MFDSLGVLVVRSGEDVVGKNIQVYLERSCAVESRIENLGLNSSGRCSGSD